MNGLRPSERRRQREDSRTATVRSIRPAVDADAVEALEEWLAMAKRGEIVGVVMLGNMPGDTTVHRWSGEMQFSKAVFVFEQWKFHHLARMRDESD